MLVESFPIRYRSVYPTHSNKALDAASPGTVFHEQSLRSHVQALILAGTEETQFNGVKQFMK